MEIVIPLWIVTILKVLGYIALGALVALGIAFIWFFHDLL